MSLLDEFTESCNIIDKRTVADGYGGFITEIGRASCRERV